MIAEQYNYDLNALHQIVANGEGTLTDEWRAVYDAILTMVENNQAGASFLHSAGGCERLMSAICWLQLYVQEKKLYFVWHLLELHLYCSQVVELLIHGSKSLFP